LISLAFSEEAMLVQCKLGAPLERNISVGEQHSLLYVQVIKSCKQQLELQLLLAIKPNILSDYWNMITILREVPQMNK